MNRRALFATTARRTCVVAAAIAALSVAAVPPRPAHALFGVGDIVFDPTVYAQALLTVKQLRDSYGVLQDQYNTLQRTYDVLSHPNQILGYGRQLLDQQMRSPGSRPANIPGLAFGSQLSSAASRFLGQNRYAETKGDDFAALEMQRREQATANIQAEAQAGMERAEERISGLDELLRAIPDQPDVTALAALQARIQSEQTFLQNEASNVARLQLIQQTAERVDRQRGEQNARQGAEDWHDRAAALAFGGGE